MATLKEFRDERLRKLDELREKGVNIFPTDSHRTIDAQKVIDNFDSLQGKTETVAGRIKSIRKFGALAFIVLEDQSGRVQLFFTKTDVEPFDANNNIGLENLNLLDTGDFIEATGEVIKTKTDEISINVRTIRLLTKSLRPMPLAHEEFSDKEERLRRRYIDINVNKNIRERFVRRSKFWQATRQFLLDNGFIEINIPVLEHTTGGAAANPFVTHMDALDEDFYLRISHELPLKRLIGAGYEKIFDIGPRFRNEGISEEHLPEHIAMEWYWAYADWEDGMRITEEMVKYIADQTWGRRQFTINGAEIDLDQEFPKISLVDLLKEHYDVNILESLDLEMLRNKLKAEHIEVSDNDGLDRMVDNLWKKLRKNISGPAFLVDIPVFLQPLAKKQAKNPLLTEQFNLLLGGTEACKAYSELNDPIDQLERFIEQQKNLDSGDKEAMMMDIDFIEMLEYGMPPACGYGNSERLFWLLEGVTAREGVPFPHLRRDISETTREIYPNIKF